MHYFCKKVLISAKKGHYKDRGHDECLEILKLQQAERRLRSFTYHRIDSGSPRCKFIDICS